MKLHGLIADHVTPKVSDGDVCFTLTGGFFAWEYKLCGLRKKG